MVSLPNPNTGHLPRVLKGKYRMRFVLTLAFIGLSWSATTAQEITFQKTYSINQPPLKCREVREKIRTSQTSVCTLTGIAGKFAGGGERGRILFRRGRWEFRGTSCQPDVTFEVTCFAMPGGISDRLDASVRGRRGRGAIERLREELQSLREDHRRLVRQLRSVGATGGANSENSKTTGSAALWLRYAAWATNGSKKLERCGVMS